jgi:hypothetical protein
METHCQTLPQVGLAGFAQMGVSHFFSSAILPKSLSAFPYYHLSPSLVDPEKIPVFAEQRGSLSQ